MTKIDFPNLGFDLEPKDPIYILDDNFNAAPKSISLEEYLKLLGTEPYCHELIREFKKTIIALLKNTRDNKKKNDSLL